MFVYLKYIQCAKTCKNMQKCASQVLTDQKTCISSTYWPKNVHLKVSFTKNVQKTCKNVQKRAKTCISNVFGPYSRTCIVKVRASWGRVSRGLTVFNFLFSGEPYYIIQQFMHNACEELFRQLKEWLLPKFATYGNQRNSFSYMYDPVTYDYIFHRR